MESTLNPSGATVVKKFENNQNMLTKNVVLATITVIVIGLGIGLGYLLSGAGKSNGIQSNSSSVVSTKNEAGIADESKFSTTTDGVLEEGGISDEGTHHLVRGSGPSQYAYLTSSVVDLSSFVGKKVQVWGDTMSGKKAGWLIDVGKIKVVE
jgi:hypothetical protein